MYRAFTIYRHCDTSFMLILLNPYKGSYYHFMDDEPEALRGYLNYLESPS